MYRKMISIKTKLVYYNRLFQNYGQPGQGHRYSLVILEKNTNYIYLY